MRCLACNELLNDFESTRKLVSTGHYLDFCGKCYAEVQYDIPTVVRADLNPNEQPDGYEDDWDEADVWLFDNDPDRE